MEYATHQALSTLGRAYRNNVKKLVDQKVTHLTLDQKQRVESYLRDREDLLTLVKHLEENWEGLERSSLQDAYDLLQLPVKI
jgi:hypothetical protein